MRRVSKLTLAVCVGLALVLAAPLACRRAEKPSAAAKASPPPRPTPAPAIPFREAAKEAGVDFTHVTGATGKKWMPETMGGGVAVLDYDGDGKPDLLFVSGTFWPGDPRAKTARSSLALYRNDGPGPDGLPRFRNVTREAGLERVFYGMGASVADYDNDGRDDVYVTALNRNFLFHNVGGRFEEVSDHAGVRESGWSTSSAWLDFDGDGRLDLFVCRYVDWSPAKDLFCTLDGKTKSYCTPERYPGAASHLYRNAGGGRFVDVTNTAGVGNANQKALGVAPWDFDGDGKVDILVANDTAPNNLFRNRGDGTFEDVGISTGVAVDEAGRARGAMGAAWGDIHNAAGASVAIGNFSNELKSLYTTETGEVFLDESPRSGVGPGSLLQLTFGVLFLDADLDGRTDLLLANGHVEPTIQQVQKDVTYAQPPTLFRNAGNGRFDALGERSGDLSRPLVARGAAAADLDGDGDVDVILVENGGSARIYLNPTNTPAKAVRLRLAGSGASNRDAVGARVTASIGGRTLTQQVSGGQSYLSASEKTLTFGLGDAARIDAVEIRWPDGRTQKLENVPGGARLVVKEP